MKRNILYFLTGLVFLLNMYACSENEVYPTSIVKQIEIFLDGKPWSVSVGIKTRPLFLYKEDGEYFANYSMHNRFQLPNDNYKVIATPYPDQIPHPNNLNEIIIPQDPEAKARFASSAPFEYSSPFEAPLSIQMHSQTGVLRLKATDKKSDMSYSKIRAVVSTPISGYKLSEAKYVETPMEVIREKATTSGGVNYTDDMVLFETQSIGQNISIRIDYLDKNNTVIQSKNIEGLFPILPADTTQIAFALNNADEPMIQDYTVTIASEGWNEENLNPEAPVLIPEGYTVVSDGENINTVYNMLKNDANVTEVKLFLRAGATYTIDKKVLIDVFKGFHFVGEKPVNGAEPAHLIIHSGITIGTAAEKATIDAIHFENLIIEDDARVFEFKGQLCEVNTISFVNCEFPNFGTVPLWYQNKAADYAEVIHNFIIDNCRFYNIGGGFLALQGGSLLPIYNIEFKNSTFHLKGLSGNLIGNLQRVPNNLSVTVENCTVVNAGSGDITLFNLDGSAATNFTVNIKKNLFSGVSETGKGKWAILKNVTSRNISDNYHTKDFVLGDWGVDVNEEPIGLGLTTEELFKDLTLGDFTIKDKTSEIFTKKIGDPHWTKE